jgi:hypothetical protein
LEEVIHAFLSGHLKPMDSKKLKHVFTRTLVHNLAIGEENNIIKNINISPQSVWQHYEAHGPGYPFQ